MSDKCETHFSQNFVKIVRRNVRHEPKSVGQFVGHLSDKKLTKIFHFNHNKTYITVGQLSDKYKTDKNNKFISLSDICPTKVRRMTVKISFRVSNKTYDKIQKMSDTLSDTCRTAIEQYIEQSERKKSNKIQTENDKLLTKEYIDQLKKEILYLKDENVALRKQIEEDIHHLHSGIEKLMTNIETTKQTSKPNGLKQTKSENGRFNSRM